MACNCGVCQEKQLDAALDALEGMVRAHCYVVAGGWESAGQAGEAAICALIAAGRMVVVSENPLRTRFKEKL